MYRWEYQIVTVNSQNANNITAIEDFVNVFGSDGWELTSVVSINNLYWYFFKRKM